MRLVLAAMIGILSSTTASKGTFGGTFIGAMVSADGIVVASDSRSTFIDKNGKHIGYIDGMPKIYVQHGAAVAVSGLTSVEDELFSAFMGRNNSLLARPVRDILYDVALRLPFRNATGVLLITAGFAEGSPTICAKTPTEPQSCLNSGYIANKNSPTLRRWFEARKGRLPSTDEAAAALGEAIRDAGDLDPTVGGPITLLLVSKSGPPRWLLNPPNDNGWSRVCDLVRAHRAGRTTILFTNTKQELDGYLNNACPK
jgi:hypothetical protein